MTYTAELCEGTVLHEKDELRSQNHNYNSYLSNLETMSIAWTAKINQKKGVENYKYTRVTNLSVQAQTLHRQTRDLLMNHAIPHL
jgi:hypothetical protein